MSSPFDEVESNLDSGLVTEVVRQPRAKKNMTQRDTLDAQPRTKIILEENENIPPSGQFIGVNGVGYLIVPGVEVNVPESVLEVLDNAVMSFPVQDPYTKQVIGYRDRLRFPYRIVRDNGKRDKG
jgi:hypothetical protein